MKILKSCFTKRVMKWIFALVEIIRMDHWLKVPSGLIIYKILVESIRSFYGKHNWKYKSYFKIHPVCYSCQCIWQVLPVVSQMSVTMKGPNFNFFIFFLNKWRKFHFLISFVKGLIVKYCYSGEESKHYREECFVTYTGAFVAKHSSMYIFSSSNWFIIAINFEKIFWAQIRLCYLIFFRNVSVLQTFIRKFISTQVILLKLTYLNYPIKYYF
jgi:hypothetical protein